jgi:poly-beta-1,6-N-acetyl-D-glucosamine biosynthesis protein PgaD
MNQPPSHPWPPIIESARAPLSARVRDFVLTVAAWALFLYFIRNAAAIAVGDVTTPILALATMHPREWLDLAYNLRYYLLTASVMMAWVVSWAFRRRRQLRQTARVKSPIHLPMAQHAASFGLKPETLEAWRESKVVVIQFDQEGHVVIDPPSPDPNHQLK